MGNLNRFKNIALEKDTQNQRRKYCKECGGFVLVRTSYGNKLFCGLCNNLINMGE